MTRLSCRRAIELKATLQDTRAEVHTPSDGDYADRIRGLELGEVESGAIVQVTTTDEVSRVLSYATHHHIPIIVHGGAFATRSSLGEEGGIIISLARMSKVVVDPASRTLAAQGGARWEDLVGVAGASGLTVVPATGDDTPADAGTGAGSGWLMGCPGAIIDNLVSVKIVLADGSIVTTSSTEKPDLFWALHHAGGVFGLATELVFRVYPQGRKEGPTKSSEADCGAKDGLEDSGEDDLPRLQKLKRQYDPHGLFGNLDSASLDTRK
ncbi:FAD-binding oxidoreductase [Aspergillus brunneoviolaceus CBS 621.78]|uniref:FAD-binding domain-containing protein n=1 Tax=Aspergillus brunneoviolaceus CBS 621.78 TaxID=1450534 RepID=A0ACD1FXX1_9EURO|nr:FAD-binding domain-containing protein [Aspergillus brunneoviolaceus CBS 621.78]RAH41826.1 FAD-binding domain-containing protein [Aspergillus brunneoviolaceus CBS 621.78]